MGWLYQPAYVDKATGERRHSSIWWWDPPGGLPRVSTGCRERRDAEAWRIQRLAEMGRGSTIGLRARQVTFEDLCRMIEDDYAAKGNRSIRDLRCRLKFLRRRFSGRLATDIPDDEVTAYVAERRAQLAAVATINMELRHLKRMFALARKRIPREAVPEVEMLKGEHVRRDVLADADYRAILAELPDHHAAAIEGLRLTGWREEEVLGLEWARVDRAALDVRLDWTKTGEPRYLSFAGYLELRQLIERQDARRLELQARGVITPWVFPQRNGKRISRGALQQAWKKARVGAGVVAAEGPYIHGLRRKMAKDLLDSGASESDAMEVTGHRSRNTFRRYGIRDRASQERALERLQEFRAAQAAQPEQRKVTRGEF